jgi:hypothetical protein
MALAASFFVPGLGHLIIGEAKTGIGVFVVSALAWFVLASFWPIGLLLGGAMWGERSSGCES